MKNLLISIPVLLLFCVDGYAQKKPAFSSQVYAGFVTGESATDLQLQAINGVKWNKWFGGIGAGIDWYYLRSVPVFASVNRSFLQKGKRSLFISADAGVNFPWQGNIYYDYPPYDHKVNPGLYWASGFGYKFGLGKADNSLLLHLGYSFKQLQEKVTSTYPCLIPPCPVNTETYDYKLKRLSVKLGWGF